MKKLALLSLSFALMVVGCTANDRPYAGIEGSLNAPPASPVSADKHPQPPSQLDPSANGGSSLPATAPYEGAGTVPQNVNPAPFLAASQEEVVVSSSRAAQTQPGAKKTAARRKK